LHSLRPCSSAASLLSKIGPRMRLISTIESRRRLVRKIVPWEYQSNPVAKVGMAEPSIRNPLYGSIPMLSHHGNDIFSCQIRLYPESVIRMASIRRDKLSKLE